MNEKELMAAELTLKKLSAMQAAEWKVNAANYGHDEAQRNVTDRECVLRVREILLDMLDAAQSVSEGGHHG